MATRDEVIANAEELVTLMLESNSPRLILSACNLLNAERQFLVSVNDHTRTKLMGRLMGKLLIKVGELTGSTTSNEHRILVELEAEAARLKVNFAAVGV